MASFSLICPKHVFGKNFNELTAEEIAELSSEELIKIVRSKLAAVKEVENGIERVEQVFDLLKYEPYLEDFPLERAEIFGDLGGQLTVLGAHLLAAEYSKLSYKYYRLNYPDRDFSTKLDGIGFKYSRAGYLDSAMVYLRKANFYKNGKFEQIDPSRLNNLGIFYLRELENDSAFYFFQLAEQYCGKDNHIFHSKIKGNQALFKYKKKQYEEAITINQEILKILKDNFEKRPNPTISRLAITNMRIADALLQLNRAKEASEYLDQMDKWFQRQSEKKFKPIQLRLQMCELKKEYFEKVGDFKQLVFYQDSIIQMQQKIEKDKALADRIATNKLFQLKTIKFEKELELQQAIANEKAQELKTLQYQKYFFGLLFLAVLTFIIFFHQRKIAINKRELKIKEMNIQLAKAEAEKEKREKKELAESLKQSEQNLDEVSSFIKVNNSWADEVVEKLESLSKTEKVEQRELETLVRGLRNRQVHSERMKLLHENIDRVNPSFYQYLSTHYPSLTASEKEVCGLIRLNLNNKDIAEFRGVTQKAVKMTRYRLRKKLEISSEINLTSFIQSLDININ